MNNTLALEKILTLKDNEENRLAEFKNVLNCSTILPKSTCKIAIVGTQHRGKSMLINLLTKDSIASSPSISIPICIAVPQKTKNTTETTEFCKNNNVKHISQTGSFCWSNTQSHSIPAKQSLDQVLKQYGNNAGIFLEYSNPNHEIAKKNGLLIPPDILTGKNQETRTKQILNAVDVADIIMIVATTKELNSDVFDFLYKQEVVIASKPVILFVVHDEISNFFHYPINEECSDASKLESSNRDSAKDAYDIINKKYTSEELSQSIKSGMKKDVQTLMQNLEKLIKRNFKKTNLHAAYYLPTGEKSSSHTIIEDQKIITDVKNWQLERIYEEMVQVSASISEGHNPFIAWEYFFRKSEDICFDTLSPICQQLKIDLVADYAKEKIVDCVLRTQEDEIAILLRDYSNSYDEEKIKTHFFEYRKKSFGLLSQSNDKLEKIKSSILSLLKETAYCQFWGRIKNQYKMNMPTIEQIVEEAFSQAQTQDDSAQFVQYINEKTTKKQIIENWRKESPLVHEKNSIASKNRKRTSNLKASILSVLDSWIEISQLVDCKKEIDLIVSKREELASFAPQTIFQTK